MTIDKLIIPNVPLLIFDLDGTIIDTDLNTKGSAKYQESLEIVLEKTGNHDIQKFENFYQEFNKEAVGMTLEEASKIFAQTMNKIYGTNVKIKEFVSYRSNKRNETYRKKAKFIGDDFSNSGSWLKKTYDEISKRLYMVTSATKENFHNIKLNPNLIIDGVAFTDFFKGIITSEDVKFKKPYPDGYNNVIKKENPVPNQNGYYGIAFEDSESGLHAAKNANRELYVAGIESTLSSEHLKKLGADCTAPKLHEIEINKLLRMAGYQKNFQNLH